MARKAGPRAGARARPRRPIQIRMYNVGFGDCFLLRLPTADGERKVLIDCGKHSLSGCKPDLKWVVDQVLRDLAKDEKDGPRVDVLIATHRHRDHVSGFALDGWDSVTVGEVWMPWTEDPDDPVAITICEAQSRRALRMQESFAGLAMEATERDGLLAFAGNNLTNEAAMRVLHGGFRGGPKRQFLPRPDDPADGSSRAPRLDDRLVKTSHLGDIRAYVLGPSRSPDVIRDMTPPQGKGYELALGLDGAGPPRPPFAGHLCRTPEDYSAWFGGLYVHDPRGDFIKKHPGYDLHLMPGMAGPDDLPREGKKLVVVADVVGRMWIRIFNWEGKKVRDCELDAEAGPESQVAALRAALGESNVPRQLSGDAADALVGAVAAVAGIKLQRTRTSWDDWAKYIGRPCDDPAMELAAALEKSVNGTSLVLAFKVGHATLFFPGDAQWGTWNAILSEERWAPLLKEVSFYKVGHHGSGNATPAEFVCSFLPQGALAMIPTDEVKRWPLIPRDTLLTDMDNRGVLFVRSDKSIGDDPEPFKRTLDKDGVTLYIDLKIPC